MSLLAVGKTDTRLASRRASLVRKGEVNSSPSSELWPTITFSDLSNLPSSKSLPGMAGTKVPSTTGPKVKVP